MPARWKINWKQSSNTVGNVLDSPKKNFKNQVIIYTKLGEKKVYLVVVRRNKHSVGTNPSYVEDKLEAVFKMLGNELDSSTNFTKTRLVIVLNK